MIVSETPKRSNSRWLQACVLLCAMVVLPLGIASAQDYEAVGRRLKAAVAAGELTGEQARAMLGALRKASAPEKDQNSERAKAYLMKVKKELGELVEAGRISKEDAAKRYEGAEKAIKERMAAASRQRGAERQRTARVDGRARYEGFERRIKAAVEAGKMTREEAGEKLEGFRRRMEMAAEQGERGERSITVEEYKRAEAKMRKMVEDGKAKPEDVERRLIEMRKMMAEQGGRQRTARGDARAEYEGFVRRIKAAVREGKMTREQAAARIEAYKKSLGRRRQAEDPDKELDYDAIAKRIKAAVRAGKLTEEEAEAKWREIKKAADAKDKKDIDYKAIGMRLRAAVKAGKMTEEEARAKMSAIKKKVSAKTKADD